MCYFCIFVPFGKRGYNRRMNLLYLGGVVLTYALGVGSVTDSISRMPLVRVDANTSTLESTNVPTAVAAKDHSAAVAVQDHKRNGEVIQAPQHPTPSSEYTCPPRLNINLEAKTFSELKKQITWIANTCVFRTGEIRQWLRDQINSDSMKEEACQSLGKVERTKGFVVSEGVAWAKLTILPERVLMLNGRPFQAAVSICLSGECVCRRG